MARTMNHAAPCYEIYSSLLYFLSHPNNLLSTLFSKIIGLLSDLNVTHHVSHAYSLTLTYIWLYNMQILRLYRQKYFDIKSSHALFMLKSSRYCCHSVSFTYSQKWCLPLLMLRRGRKRLNLVTS